MGLLRVLSAPGGLFAKDGRNSGATAKLRKGNRNSHTPDSASVFFYFPCRLKLLPKSRGEHVRILDGVDITGTPTVIGEELRTTLAGDHTWFFVGLSADEYRPEVPVPIALAFRLDLNQYAAWQTAGAASNSF